MIARRVE